jgi:hypothetical protein
LRRFPVEKQPSPGCLKTQIFLQFAPFFVQISASRLDKDKDEPRRKNAAGTEAIPVVLCFHAIQVE